MIGIKFGDFDMQSGGCTVTDTDVDSSPSNSIQADQLPEADGAIVVKQQYTSKTFTVNGNLKASPLVPLKTLRDQFKLAMSVKNQAFDVNEDGTIRRYLCNAQNVIIARRSNITAGFSVQMMSPDGMGWDIDSTTLLAATGITLSTQQTAITIDGTYQAEPYISFILGSVTADSSNTVTISNGTTLRSISVTRSWAAGDKLEIDSLKKTIFVNNAPVEFNGQFPRWDVGTGSIGYLDDFTGRNGTLTMNYTRRWL